MVGKLENISANIIFEGLNQHSYRPRKVNDILHKLCLIKKIDFIWT